eukprot:scaffold20985_cov58-Skeletonema_marinoi.AAC.1
MLTAEFDMLECFPDQLEELKAVFSDSAGSPRDSLVVHQELTTSKDRHETMLDDSKITVGRDLLCLFLD